MRSSSRALSLSRLALAAVLLGCTSDSDSDADSDVKRCTTIGCGSRGVQIDFVETQTGAYTVDLVVDGVTASCAAAIPLDPSATGSDCSDMRFGFIQSGSMLPVANQSVGGVMLDVEDAKSVTIRVSRDGTKFREATFVPTYVTTPNPNGPGCGADCRGAKHTLP